MISGIIALISFWFLVLHAVLPVYLLSGIEFILLLLLGWEIILYAALQDLDAALQADLDENGD